MGWLPARFAALIFLLCGRLFSQVEFLGPIPYRSVADSPCAWGPPGSTFFLEDFEDGSLNFPAGIDTYNGTVLQPSGTTDSVDADDGVLDGHGDGGHSLLPLAVQMGLSFPPVWQTSFAMGFSQETLGYLPNCAGFVVTDGLSMASINLVVRLPNQQSIAIHPSGLFGLLDDLDNGSSDDDWFLGVRVPTGFVSVRITHTYQAVDYEPRFEIDHAQFGLIAPEPAPIVSWPVFLVVLVRQYRSRRLSGSKQVGYETSVSGTSRSGGDALCRRYRRRTHTEAARRARGNDTASHLPA